MPLDEALGETLEPGWFRDRIAARIASRTGDGGLLGGGTAAEIARSAQRLLRMRPMIAIELALLGAGLLALIRLAWRRGALARVSAALLPPPWRGWEGVVVLVRGGALGVIALGTLYLYSVVGPERPFTRVMLGTATNLAFVPVLVLAYRRLLRPSGLRFGESLGLVPVAGRGRNLALVFLTLLAIGQLGEGVMDVACRWLGLSAHWTEWFDRELVWGAPVVVGVTLLDTVVLTPVFEEIVFRGLLFATLRRRFGWRSEEHTSELQSRSDLVCRLLLEKKKNNYLDAT